jgi:hypothetical protein
MAGHVKSQRTDSDLWAFERPVEILKNQTGAELYGAVHPVSTKAQI